MMRFFSLLTLLSCFQCMAQPSFLRYYEQRASPRKLDSISRILFESESLNNSEKLSLMRKVLCGNDDYLRWNDSTRENNLDKQKIDLIKEVMLNNMETTNSHLQYITFKIRSIIRRTQYPLLSNSSRLEAIKKIKSDVSLSKSGRKAKLRSYYIFRENYSSEPVLKQEEDIREIISAKNTNSNSETELSSIQKVVKADSNYLIWNDSIRQKQLSEKKISMIKEIMDTVPSSCERTSTNKLSDIKIILKLSDIIDLNSEDNKLMRSQKLSLYNKNAFKFDLMRTFSYGEFIFSYERSINKRLSCEIGAGPALSYYELFIDHDEGDQSEFYEGQVIRSLMAGFALHSGFRAYVQKSRNGLAGFYVNPSLRYRFDTWGHHHPNRSTGTLCLNIGYQTWWGKHMGIDFTIGAGLAYTSGYVRVYAMNGFTEFAGYASTKYEHDNYFSPYLNLGLKLIVGW